MAQLKLESRRYGGHEKDGAGSSWLEDESIIYTVLWCRLGADEASVECRQELTELADGAGEFVYVDNYFVLKYEFNPEWMDVDDLEKKLGEFEEFADSEEVAKFLTAYEGES